MLDERLAELIQADIDGELGAEQRAEVSRALEASEEARVYHSEMLRVARLMAETPDQDPPFGMRKRILDSIELPAAGTSWFRPASYGFAMAAGVLLAVGVISIAPMGDRDLGSLVGTMVNDGQDISNQAEDGLTIDLAEINGQVWLKDLDHAWAVEFELESEMPVDVMVDLNDTGMRFGGYADQAGYQGEEVLKVSGGEVRVVNQGTRHFVLFLRNIPEQKVNPQEIGIAVILQGENIYQGYLQSGG